jgi:deoxyribose-phosphate aldolase
MTDDAPTDAAIAARALACLDLTDLGEAATEADADALCDRARTRHGPTAAICLWPRFVARARARLGCGPVRIATVVNFPIGGELIAPVVEETRTALAAGADEIDVVLPYRAFAEGRADVAARLLDAVRAASSGRVLKVILETGMLREAQLIRRAADLAIAEGADFVKTSTGKVEVNATPDAARALLEAIKASGRPVGLKPSGGIRSLSDARLHLTLADRAMGPGWARPSTFRIGASGVLAALLAALDGAEAPVASTVAY